MKLYGLQLIDAYDRLRAEVDAAATAGLSDDALTTCPAVLDAWEELQHIQGRLDLHRQATAWWPLVAATLSLAAAVIFR